MSNEMIGLWIVIFYGVALGINNYAKGIISIFKTNTYYVQNTIGKILDIIWLMCVIYYLTIGYDVTYKLLHYNQF